MKPKSFKPISKLGGTGILPVKVCAFWAESPEDHGRDAHATTAPSSFEIGSFDCVEMKRRGAMEVRKKLAGKTVEEQIEYWRKRTEELRARQRGLREKA